MLKPEDWELYPPPPILPLRSAEGEDRGRGSKFMANGVRTLSDYRKIASNCQRAEISVKGEEIREALSWLQRSRAKFIFKPGPCQIGDFVEIEYWSPQINNGEKIKDGFILGQGYFISGFEENLVGLKAGQEKEEFSLTFPADSLRKDLAGQKVVFRVRVNSVQKIELPEINDQFAQNLGRFENLNELRESIREGIFLEKEKAERERLRAEILRKINQGSEFEISADLIEAEKKRMLEELKQTVAKNLKISFADYLIKIKKGEKEILEAFYFQAEARIKNSLILREIAKREKIEVSEEEVKEEIDKILKHYSGLKEAEALDLDYLKRYIKEVITNEKTLQRLESFTKL